MLLPAMVAATRCLGDRERRQLVTNGPVLVLLEDFGMLVMWEVHVGREEEEQEKEHPCLPSTRHYPGLICAANGADMCLSSDYV